MFLLKFKMFGIGTQFWKMRVQCCNIILGHPYANVKPKLQITSLCINQLPVHVYTLLACATVHYTDK
jgi:hypothetical protein